LNRLAKMPCGVHQGLPILVTDQFVMINFPDRQHVCQGSSETHPWI
jgi:hypothetical protein